MAEPWSADDLIPVTVVGGYLGAGKTTLINQMLAGDHGRRLGVLVNDFGSVTIDAQLIATNDGSTIALENGCVCCSLVDSLGEALDRILAQPGLDHVVIEASGVAEPSKVAVYGQGWPRCRLAGVVVLADSADVRRLASDRFVGGLITRQLEAADLIVATKLDLLAEVERQPILEWLTARSQGAPVTAGRELGRPMDLGAILDRPANLRTLTDAGAETASDLFTSFALAAPEDLTRARLDLALEAWPATIVRIKGVLALEDGRTYVVHRVGRRWSVDPHEGAATPLVCIALRSAGSVGPHDIEWPSG